MSALIGCEESGEVRDAMLAAGHDAWSCDTKPGRGKTLGQHYPNLYPPGHRLHDMRQHHQCSIFDLFTGPVAHSMRLEGQGLTWGLMIAHPPCTYLSGSGAWAFKDGPYHQEVKPTTLTGAARRQAQREALEFVLALYNSPVPRVCIENPIGMLSTLWRKPDQVIIVKISVLDDYSFEPVDYKLVDVIDKLHKALAKIPAEYRESATFNLSIYGDYASYGSLEIGYQRPETDEEMQARMAKESDYERQSREDREAHDRREFERLKRKFEQSDTAGEKS